MDKETGVCLMSTDDSNLLGFELGAANSFTCTQFVTENVVLPLTEGN